MDKPHEHGVEDAIPATPGQAEGSEEVGEQSQNPIAPQQTDQAEGELEDAPQ
jgi:hypothetical protein